MEEEEILFVITVADVQHWAEEKLGRRLTYEELQIAKDKLEWGLSEDIDMVYNTIDLIITSPPYADQRKSTYGGISTDQYVEWFLPISEQ